MVKPEVRNEYKKWLELRKLDASRAASIAFIPRSTYNEVFIRKRIAPQHRLYLLTQIEGLKLTPQELEEYEQLKRSNPAIAQAELVAKHFIKEYSENGNFPSIKYCLVPAANLGIPVQKVLNAIIDDGIVPGLIGKRNKPLGSRGNSSPGTTGVLTAEDVKSFNAKLQRLLSEGTDEEIKSILSDSKMKSRLQQVYGGVHVLLADNPTASVAGVRKGFAGIN